MRKLDKMPPTSTLRTQKQDKKYQLSDNKEK
jgi:hypothetical protein